MEETAKKIDSGYVTDSTISVKRNLNFDLFESTPRRKRKNSVTERGQSLHSSGSDTSYYSCEEIPEVSFNENHFVISSPVTNNVSECIKLSTSLERCTLDDVESQLHNTKRCKWDDTFESRKSNSAPSTPTRSGNDCELFKKYHSLEFTPTKTHQKIGTPERNALLYPELIEKKPAVKIKSPEKFRKELKRLSGNNKPVTSKKRLFICRDFVYLFTRKHYMTDIVHKIFSYLNDEDLLNVGKVSNLWRNVLQKDSNSYKRYKTYSKRIMVSKENIYGNSDVSFNSSYKSKNYLETPINSNTSTPLSPGKERWQRVMRMIPEMTKSQHLTKCIACLSPAFLENKIAQCTRPSCQYLWCKLCNYGTHKGPKNFHCHCINPSSPPSPGRDRTGLVDISNNSGNSSFFINESSLNTSSSGYYSQSDVDRSTVQSFSQKNKSTVLTDLNRSSSVEKRHQDRINIESFHNVAMECLNNKSSRKKSLDTEPSSPPKIKYNIGSQKSKKNLKRLCM